MRPIEAVEGQEIVQDKGQRGDSKLRVWSRGQDTTHLKQAEKTTTKAYEKAEMVSVIEQVFQLYANLLTEKARQP